MMQRRRANNRDRKKAKTKSPEFRIILKPTLRKRSILSTSRSNNPWVKNKNKKKKGNRSISLPQISRPQNDMKQIKRLFNDARRKGKKRNLKIPVKVLKPQSTRRKKVKKRNFETRSRYPHYNLFLFMYLSHI